jgi:fucose permease
VAGLGFANIFPLVFSIAVEKMPSHTNELSGLMVTAIVGGAFLPPVMGMLADRTTVTAGFLVPIAAVGYITWVSIANLSTTAGGGHA